MQTLPEGSQYYTWLLRQRSGLSRACRYTAYAECWENTYWQSRGFPFSVLASSVQTLVQYHHLVSQLLPKLQDSALCTETASLDRLQLTSLTICWTSGVADLVSDKPPGIIVAGNFSETMSSAEEGSSAQSEQSHQASHIYTYTHTRVMESYDLQHMEPTITELEERNGENRGKTWGKKEM